MNYDKYVVYDAETDVNNVGEDAVGNSAASPFCMDNKIVMDGVKLVKCIEPEYDGANVTTDEEIVGSVGGHVKDAPLMVGHNIKFDLLYLMRYDRGVWEWLQAGGRVWDTMLAEYLLTFQQSKMASLDDVSEKYGGSLKPDGEGSPKWYWENGYSTRDIPEDVLEEYLLGDLENTDIVFQAQLKLARQLGMLPLIESQMEALIATTLMEWNGMKFDEDKCLEVEASLAPQVDVLERKLINGMVKLSGLSPKLSVDWNPGSPKQLSAVLFGGDISYTETRPATDPTTGEVVRYKTGKKKGEIKTRKVNRTQTIGGFFAPINKIGKAGYYSTGDSVVKKLVKNCGGLPKEFLTDLLEYRKLTKQLNTYFRGLRGLVFADGCIHGNLQHTTTNTGRLSSSNPNLQNITT